MKNENVMLSYEMKGYGVWLQREGIVTRRKSGYGVWRIEESKKERV